MGADGVQQEPERLLEGDIAQKFSAQVLEQAREARLTSDEHSSVDENISGSLGQPEKLSARRRISA